MRTRAQEDMILAERLVSEVEKIRNENGSEGKTTSDIYGGLCHSFPVLVRTCGLCQALAFSTDKATATEGNGTSRNRAHGLLLKHVGQILGIQGDVLAAVRGADATQYMFYTRRALSAWVYFKRFAVSILKMESGQDGREAEDAV
jgi:CRISPR-associated protein Cmr5